ncbi:MAG: hypothetical protein ACYDD4_12790, partial [Acidimicrobiales bacterium]
MEGEMNRLRMIVPNVCLGGMLVAASVLGLAGTASAAGGYSPTIVVTTSGCTTATCSVQITLLKGAFKGNQSVTIY